ncbi:TRAP transporter small permease [Serinibacter salmoneus]|uniref:TRAP-type C4-dicarboxylate transport system permease small subunit n=1 Tax=Serinibacter salmoneus TaxID=556530 RepID=A0A2A9D1U7_9MICO|nr:TRAP transporter small permease [Serinibacter salmoneus]PFG20644.1 TRAP-type C4-dicarboxylate transport system permease small subunit [Serinibacter salmoneus]
MTRFKEGLDKALEWLCVVLFALLVVTVAWQVFTRQVLNDPSGWSEELAKYTFIWLGLFAAALMFGERGHIAVDFVVRKMPAGVQHWIGVFGQLVIALFAVIVMIYGGYKVSALAWNQNLTGLPVNVGWLYTALPVAGVLILFYSVYHLISLLRHRESALEEGDPELI